MNTGIMAERQAKAIQAIADEVIRLGGRFEQPSGRAPNPQVKHTLTLEAVAAALAGIAAAATLLSSGKHDDEASITVVKEPEAAKSAPAGKAKRGKE